MLRSCALLAILALAVPALGAPRILVADLQARGVEPSVALAATDALATALGDAAPGISLLSSEEVKVLIRGALEKQLLGCLEDKCFVDVGLATGADEVITGSVAKVGDGLVISLTRLDVAKHEALARTTVTAKRQEDLVSAIAGAARQLIAKAPLPATAKSLTGAPEAQVEVLKSHEHQHWIAVQHAELRREGKKPPRTLYRAYFESDHFAFLEYDRLMQLLPIQRDLPFYGEYHSCKDREHAYLDAFTMREEKPLAIKVPPTVAEALIKQRRARKLVLDLTFEVVTTKIHTQTEFDWKDCKGTRKPFQTTSIAPNVWIKVVQAELWDAFSDKRHPLVRQEYDAEKDDVEVIPLPRPPPLEWGLDL